MRQATVKATKNQRSWRTAKKLILEYLQISTIHGVKYIAEKNRSWIEKGFWVLVICVSVLCCGQLIMDAWNINPMIISFTEKPTPIWQIPFPAVTICPISFVSHKFFNVSDFVYRFRRKEILAEDLSEEENEYLLALNNICIRRTAVGKYEQKADCNDCLKTMRKVKVPPEELFVECRFQNRVIDCQGAFKEIIVDAALCYTFNFAAVYRNDSEIQDQDWTIDGGYRSEATVNAYPRRALGAGKRFGLSVLLKTNKLDISYVCHGIAGYWVEFTMPHDYPRFFQNYYTLRLEDALSFVVDPKLLTTAVELRNYPSSLRKCHFSNEHRLKYFQEYTPSNCKLECEVDIVLENCGCLLFFIEDRGTIDACGPYQYECMYHSKNILYRNNYVSCNCLPGCSIISFDSVVSTTTLNVSNLLQNRSADQEQFKYSELTVYFKENQFMNSQRSEIYGRTVFLANCGGLLNLCLGVSVISFFEIFYFCTIRFYNNMRGSENQDHEERVSAEKLHVIGSNAARLARITRELLADYSQKTTIQGINYVADKKLSLAERLWWATVVLMSIICCGSLIAATLGRYYESPMVISYENEETLSSQIPFPAVTVCPQFVTKNFKYMYKSLKVDNFSLYDYGVENFNFVTAVAQVCDPEVLGNIDPENRTTCENCAEYLRKSLPQMDAFFESCAHIHFDQLCSEMFEEVVTEEGVCYTYNGLDIYRKDNVTGDFDDVEWTLEGGYKNKTEQFDIYPRAGSEFPLALQIEVPKFFNDGLCKGPILGFKVYLHLPNEIPHISKHYYLVPYKQTVQISAIPKMIITAPELRHVSVEKRQCFFSDERYLRFFKYYTQRNCEFECEANLTVKVCGCLRFDMPRISGVKYCGISDIKCYRGIAQLSVEKTTLQLQSRGCNCLASCTSITYDAELNPLGLSDDAIMHNRNDSEYLNYFSVAGMIVYTKSNPIVALKMTRLYGITELLANCGGLLGLFLGFSIVSILELIYFFSLRLGFNIRMMFYN